MSLSGVHFETKAEKLGSQKFEACRARRLVSSLVVGYASSFPYEFAELRGALPNAWVTEYIVPPETSSA